MTEYIRLIVRIINDLVIVERDQNDKPLVDALVQAGIPARRLSSPTPKGQSPKWPDALLLPPAPAQSPECCRITLHP